MTEADIRDSACDGWNYEGRERRGGILEMEGADIGYRVGDGPSPTDGWNGKGEDEGYQR